MVQSKNRVRVGCCGFNLSRGEYFRRFSVVEVQHTFYEPPRIETLERWRAEAPRGFEFAIKAWMLITHESRSPTYRRLKRPLTEAERAQCGAFRPTPIVEEAWEKTLASAKALGAKKILFQCPASFVPSDENLDNLQQFFSGIAKPRGIRFLWEPRGGWPQPLVAAVCRELNLTHVVDPFTNRTATPRRVYFRIPGRRGLPYEDDELGELASLLPPDQPSYVMFYNVQMVKDAARLRAILDAAV